MKANGAPEKIYLFKNPIDGTPDYRWLSKMSCSDDVEYIRTDAFIEKALDYIENNIYDHYDGDHEYGICGGYVKKEKFIEDFVKYMKGE